MQSLEVRVIGIVADVTNQESEKITLGSHLLNDLNADSLDCVEITMALEETFKVEIPDEEAEKLLTVKDIVDHVRKIST